MRMDSRELGHFELRELHYFVALAEELHFARAAERVGINQSPLSKAITLMERRLGVRLFVRDRRSTQLTPIGETLLVDARRILAEADQAHRGIVAAAAGRTGRLRIAITDGLAHPRVARLLRRIYNEESKVSVQVSHCVLSEQLRLLRSNLLDVGLAVTAPDFRTLTLDEPASSPSIGFSEDVDARPVWKDSLSVVIERTHSLASKTEIDWQDLRAEQLIAVGERLAIGAPLDAVTNGARVSLLRVEYVESVELLLTLVAAGEGVGLLGSALAETIHRDDLALRSLSTRRPKVTTFLLRRSDDDSPLVARFVERTQKST